MRKLSSMILALVLVLNLAMAPGRAAEERTPEAILAGMTVEEKVAQIIMPAFRWYPDENGERQNVTTLPADVAAILEKYGFAGVTLFAQNTADTAAAVQLVDDMQKANAAENGRTQLLIAIDQEGGRVTRLGHGTQMPGNMALGAANDASLAAAAAATIGDEIMSMGINFNFAPVLDVNSNPANPVIGTRSFSDDPAIVAAQGVSYMKALQGTGAISTLKHFPGHGDTATDSHTGLPLVDKSYEELKARELVPFQAAIDAGADAVMTAHIQYPQIETGTYTSKETGEQVYLPATLSKTILTDILRGDMGFDGVIITDAMEMDAIAKHFDRYDTAKLAIEAGVDILLMPADTSTPEGLADLEGYIQKLTAMVQSGEIAEKQVDDAVLHVLRLKADHGLIAPYVGVDKNASQIVGSAAHHETEWEITKKTITLVKNDNGTLPLTKENQKIAVLTAYDNEVLSMEHAIGRLKDEGKLAKGTEITVQSIQKKTAEEAIACAAGTEHVVIITELGSAAGLKNDTAKTVDALIESVHKAGGDVIIMSCSLPYDAARYQAADAIVIAWSARGMSEDPRVTDGNVAQYGPSMPAALYLMLSPDETPTGKLPVNIPGLTDELTYSDETLYERGFGLRYGKMFEDVDSSAWYMDGVRYCVDNGLMSGVSETEFAPFATLSRATLTTILYRMAGSPASSGATAFSDVKDGLWYTDAARWAAAEGVVTGYDGKFAPDDPVTREQIVTILWRYAKLAGADVSIGEETNILSYDDAFDVSQWAIPAMQWAVGSGVIGGKTQSTLAPKDTATRAEIAVIMTRLPRVRITMNALIEANSTQSLLARHKSLLLEYGPADSDEKNCLYLDADYLYQKVGYSSVVVDYDEIWQVDDVDGGKAFYYCWFAMDEAEEKERRTIPSDFEFLDTVNTSREIIADIRDNKDGTLTLTTLLGAEDTAESMEYYDEEYPEGASRVEQRMEYVVDEKTLEIKASTTTMVVDGEDGDVTLITMTYDADRPDDLTSLAALIKELPHSEKTDPRTVKVVYDYGTDQEQTYEIVVEHDYRVITNVRRGYYSVYSDPEKINVYGGDGGEGDVTIYAFAGE
ncbi:MAG: hypothetical protein E7425_05520 [Ruminococcaceae bacterium]|nr:hypothetical protein [Oscillospiraceae bacterium]